MIKNSSLISDCASALHLNSVELARLVQSGPFRYKTYPIKKRNGQNRWIAQPAKELKPVQRFLASEVLDKYQISSIATAYRKGLSILDNASPHKHSNIIFKIDFRNFFHSIYVSDFLKYLKENSSLNDNEIKFVLLSCFWFNKDNKSLALSIGAPSSPIISNVIMFDIDEKIKRLCAEKKLNVTRYADDITISGDEIEKFSEIKSSIIAILKEAPYPKLYLNDEKTVFVSKRYRRTVTGLVLSNDEKVSIGRYAKREIRAAMYRANKFGIDAEAKEILIGKVAFAQMIDKDFVEDLRRKFPLKQ